MSHPRALTLIAAFVLPMSFGAASAGDPVRGKYLEEAIMACGNCHTPKGGPLAGKTYAGGFEIKEEGIDAVASNITPDEKTGVGKWTDAQLIKAIREGKRPDGTTIGPPMPFDMYQKMSDRDATDIVAYLRTVAPVDNDTQASTYMFPLPPAWGPPVASIPHPDPANKVAYGAYLAGPAAHCMECHTPMPNPGRRDYDGKLGAGGFPFSGPWGVVVAANITPDNETGLGKWTDQQIKDAITKGVRPDGSKLTGPMAYAAYAKMKDSDLDAIVAYLRSIKPVRNKVR